MNVQKQKSEAQIIRAGMVYRKWLTCSRTEYGWSDSVSTLSAKLQRKHPIQGKYWNLPMCWDRHHYGGKETGEVMPSNNPSISPPHRRTTVLPMDSSERYGFPAAVYRSRFRKTAMQTG